MARRLENLAIAADVVYCTCMDTKNLIFDENYNISFNDDGAVYDDFLSEIVGKLSEARENGEIGDVEFRILLGAIAKKALKKDIQNATKFITKTKSKKKSLFFAYSELKRDYAS